MKERCVKNYRQYLKILKERFGEMEQMPSDEDVRDFIKQYNLYKDWQIVVSEVKADILKLIRKKTSEYKRKSISSYKEYLKKLKENFGIPDTMPEISMIKYFIEEYDLEIRYGITVNDVRKDLESFIAGKYDEMIVDAMPKYKSSVKRYVSQSYNSYNPVRTEKKTFFSSIHTRTYTLPTLPKPSKQKQQPQVQGNKQNIRKSKSSKSKQNAKKVNTKEKETTILIDGDNHINEAKRGIEHTTKSIKVRAYFSQEGAKRKFDKEYGSRPNVSSKLVKPGDQAVDNQIKSEVGELLKNKNQDIKIVSKDKGYDKYIKVKKKSGKHISRAESVRESLLGKK